MERKICNNCGVRKSVDEFTVNEAGKISMDCNKCTGVNEVKVQIKEKICVKDKAKKFIKRLFKR